MTFTPFDVVVVPFPYSDMLAEKRRPAVVVSHPSLETSAGAIWLAMVTSAPGPLRLGDATVTDLAAAGLSVACRVRAAKIATLDCARVIRCAGALAPADAAAVIAAIKSFAAFCEA